MEYTPRTAFGRPASAVQTTQVAAPPRGLALDKWELLDTLTEARAAFGLTHRDLNVLRALIGFHAGREISADGTAPVVFASNRALCERLNGMPCSTMRRHLARLVEAGIVSRRDSPNGKRYARRAGGIVIRAFGFDLTPMLVLAPRIAEAAHRAREAAEALACLRETVSLMRRDLEALATGLRGADRERAELMLDEVRKLLRRRPDAEALGAAREAMADLLPCGDPGEETPASTEEMSTSARRIEQHHQRSRKETSDEKRRTHRRPVPRSAQRGERSAVKGAVRADPEPCAGVTVGRQRPGQAEPKLSDLSALCTEARSFYPDGTRSWPDVSRTAEALAPMIGIQRDVLDEARAVMGRRHAEASVLCILQRHASIRNPGGYLRRLVSQARAGEYALSDLLRTTRRAVPEPIVS
jgi:replication initiation protein RepC